MGSYPSTVKIIDKKDETGHKKMLEVGPVCHLGTYVAQNSFYQVLCYVTERYDLQYHYTQEIRVKGMVDVR
jgi:hypothetical protein